MKIFVKFVKFDCNVIKDVVAGNPGVFQLYPYPYPPNPYPWPGVRGLEGMGKGLEGMDSEGHG